MKTLLPPIFAITLISTSCSNYKAPAPDSDQMVMATLWFQHSAEVRALYYQGYNIAQLRVEQALDTLPANLKLAVVADIDETILDNSPSEGKNILEGERYSSDRWTDWTDKSSAEGLPGSLEFAEFLQAKGVDLYYISNRSVDELDATLANLKALNYPFADKEHILLKSDESTKTPRREIVMKTHYIILLLGDNLNDFSDLFENRDTNKGFNTVDQLSQEFGKRFIILPNPLYGSWTKPIYGATSGLTPAETANERRGFLTDY